MTTNDVSGEEYIVTNATFTPALTVPWLKSNFNLTSKRVTGKVPNVILGLIPIGKREFTYPLKNISGVMVSTKLFISRLIIGPLLILFGLSTFDSSLILGLILLILGISTLANCYTTTFSIINNAGQKEGYQLSILDKSTVSQFVEKINDKVAEI